MNSSIRFIYLGVMTLAIKKPRRPSGEDYI